MDQDKLNTLFHSTTDEKYKKFLCDRGWEFETEAEVKAAYARMKKASAGEVLTEEEFLLELEPGNASDLGKQLYNRLCELVEQGALKAGDLYQYARFKWCFRHPEAVIACEVGRNRWVVNNCGEAIDIIGTPYYDATDWHFIQFRCKGVEWVMCNDSLYQIYQ